MNIPWKYIPLEMILADSSDDFLNVIITEYWMQINVINVEYVYHLVKRNIVLLNIYELVHCIQNLINVFDLIQYLQIVISFNIWYDTLFIRTTQWILLMHQLLVT